jgi:hypothetical protein
VNAQRKALNSAINQTPKQAENKKNKKKIQPKTGEDKQALVTRLYATPANVVERARQALTAKPQR